MKTTSGVSTPFLSQGRWLLGRLLCAQLVACCAHGSDIVKDKDYWVARASGGGFVGSWRATAERQARGVRFAVDDKGITVEVTDMDSRGAISGSAITFIPRSSKRLGKGVDAIGTTSMGSPDGRISKALIDGLLPSRLPQGLEDDLTKLGADRGTLFRLKSVLEGKTALERFMGSGVLDESLFNPGDLAGTGGRSKTPDRLPKSRAAGFHREGAASDGGVKDPNDDLHKTPEKFPSDPLKTESPVMTPGRVSARTVPGTEGLTAAEAAEFARQDAILRTMDASSYTRTMPGSKPLPTQQNFYLSAHDGDFNTVYRLTGKDQIEVAIIPSTGDREILELLRRADQRSLEEAARRVRTSPQGPTRNPSETRRVGGVGVEPEAWNFLRGSGLASYLWNNFVSKTTTPFHTVRQPGRGEGTTLGSVAPRVTRDALINPVEGGRPERTRRSVPDMRDPFPSSNPDGGSSPQPGPRP